MIYDVIIIGSGPAGLTAGIYCARANLKTLLIAGSKWGGQLMLTTEVENFPGFPDGILGPELMGKMRKQAERFGVEFVEKNVTRVDFSQPTKRVYLGNKGDLGDLGYEGKAVIVATGADTMWLGLPNEQKLIGRGVSSCAPCDAFFFKEKKVIVVGGGDSAMEEALVLSKFASEVTIVHRRDSFRASKIMQDRALSNPKIKTLLNSQVVDVLGKDKVEGVKLQSTIGEIGRIREIREMEVDGVFVAIGHIPNTKIFEGQLKLDENGYVLRTGKEYKSATSIRSVFVAGDVEDHHYKQAITAAGYGCEAALEVEKYLESLDTNYE